jgi:hypothetical protein
MKLLLCSALLGLSSLAAAQPAARPAPPAPQCVADNGNVELIVTATGVTGCWNADSPTKCFALSLSAAPKSVGNPVALAPTPPAVEVRDEGGKPSVCAGAKCKKLGKKTARATADWYSVPDTKAAEVTSDLKVVVIGLEAWNVGADKLLKLKPPAGYKKSDKPELLRIEAMGKFLISSWASCGGPCAMSVLADSSGANKGPWFPAGTLIKLDDKRTVIVPSDARADLTEIEATTGKQIGTLHLADGALEGVVAVRVDESSVVATWQDHTAHAWKIVWIGIPAGKSPSITITQQLAICP